MFKTEYAEGGAKLHPPKIGLKIYIYMANFGKFNGLGKFVKNALLIWDGILPKNQNFWSEPFKMECFFKSSVYTHFCSNLDTILDN